MLFKMQNHRNCYISVCGLKPEVVKGAVFFSTKQKTTAISLFYYMKVVLTQTYLWLRKKLSKMFGKQKRGTEFI